MSMKGREIPLKLDQGLITPRAGAPPWPLERKAMRTFLSAMRNRPAIAVELWDGERISACQGPPEVVLRINSRRALWGIITNPDLYFGDAYTVGAVDVEGRLLRLIELASNNRPDFIKESTWFGRLMGLMAGAPRGNTPDGAVENIHHHYDLSNEFYRLWLDREHLQYTCAYYPHPDVTLEQAQTAKLHHVCRKLRLQPGDRVIEAGCGWGGLARFMAREYGARVNAYNISHQQIMYAREKVKAEGLDHLVEYVEADYREAAGQCDVFVSVGMLEHVGKENYGELGGIIDRCLTADGRALIHTIGRNRPRVMNRWIEKRIFPGAYPPTLAEMSRIFEPYDFSVLDVENLRLHYERTIDHWRLRFEDSRDVIREMFDERFVRAWRLYLEGSIHAFRNGDLQLFQVVFQRGRSNAIPWNREHLYDHNR